MSDWYEATQADAEAEPVTNDYGSGRQSGVVKRWTEGKGFGFIERDDGGGSVFVHVRECPDRTALVPGSKVSFIFEADDKTGKARDVSIEEAAAPQTEAERVMGIVKQWRADKGFGFIGPASGEADVFFHSKDCGGVEFAKGQAVSFVLGEGPKGTSAKQVRPEEGGQIEEALVEEEAEGERQLGKVKSYNEEKGFAFIAPCSGGEDLFSHKKEFGGVEPSVGQPVSYLVKATEKGDAATKVRLEESVPEPVLSDEGREFGKVKNFNTEKGFGFINWKGEEAAVVFAKEANGLTLVSDMCVSFKQEEGAKGPLAKDIRQEDPARVARLTATVHYGTVEMYSDDPEKGYGFIKPLKASYGGPKKYYFHMSEIEDPDEDGGIDPTTNVSFIIVPARKGVQAAAVKIAEPPKDEEEVEKAQHSGDEPEATATGWGDDGFTNDAQPAAAADTSAEAEGWGTWG